MENRVQQKNTKIPHQANDEMESVKKLVKSVGTKKKLKKAKVIKSLEASLTQCELNHTKAAQQQKLQIEEMKTQIEALKQELNKKKTSKKKVRKQTQKTAIGSNNDGVVGELLVLGALGGIGFFAWKSYQKKQEQVQQLALEAMKEQEETVQQERYEYYLDQGYTKDILDSLVSQGFVLLSPAPNGDLQYR